VVLEMPAVAGTTAEVVLSALAVVCVFEDRFYRCDTMSQSARYNHKTSACH